MIRVLVADDEALIRSGLVLILEGQSDIQVAGEASDGGSAVALTAQLRPDVVLMDIRMPVLDGLEATRRVVDATAGATRVIILTTFDLNEYLYRAIRAGASGFLLKDSPPAELAHAIRVVASGDALVSASLTRRLLEHYARYAPAAPSPAAASLTDREREVLRLVARGLSNAEIAEHLVVSQSTVKTHVVRLLSKLGLRDRVQAVVYAYETGLVEPSAWQSRGILE
jgi:DNA-binding NarL/FixJ family response regulator